jgi:hypothetical protein
VYQASVSTDADLPSVSTQIHTAAQDWASLAPAPGSNPPQTHPRGADRANPATDWPSLPSAILNLDYVQEESSTPLQHSDALEPPNLIFLQIAQKLWLRIAILRIAESTLQRLDSMWYTIYRKQRKSSYLAVAADRADVSWQRRRQPWHEPEVCFRPLVFLQEGGGSMHSNWPRRLTATNALVCSL